MVAAPPLRADTDDPPRLRIMQPEERLEYENRVRMRQVVLAGAAGVLVMLAVLVQLPGAHVKVNEETLGLITEHKRIAQDIDRARSSARSAPSRCGWTLWWLFEAARSRVTRASGRPSWDPWRLPAACMSAVSRGRVRAIAGVQAATSSSATATRPGRRPTR